jgi:hypothetical protein
MRLNRILLAQLGMVLLTAPLQAGEPAPLATAPEKEPLSSRFSVRVGSTKIPTYLARIDNLSPEKRQTLGLPVVEDTDETSFASLDVAGPEVVTVTCSDPVSTARILPSSSGITPTFSGNRVSFTVAKPGQLTLEVNGDWISSLHVFANPPETNIPSPNDPNVIYFGPGVHTVESVAVTSGKTVYLAPGAVVYGTVGTTDPGRAIFAVQGSNIVVRGRGIIDGSLCPRGTRGILAITGTNIDLEGVILRDSCGWTTTIRRSDQMKVDNVKIFGWRGNSDGMDICNSRGVEVSNSFLRTFDDLVVIKSDKGQGEVRDITVRHCVLWNELAHALSIGAELREPITNVRFTDCDVIHDKGREWLLRIYNCDSALVKNTVFDDIRIEEARRLMSVWIGRAVWSREADRGHVQGVMFQNIRFVAPQRAEPWADLLGFDAEHAVDGVQFQNVVVGGVPLSGAGIRQNGFVHDVVVRP